MKKWEYATVPLMIHTTKAILDNWGEDGWGARHRAPRCFCTRRRGPRIEHGRAHSGQPHRLL